MKITSKEETFTPPKIKPNLSHKFLTSKSKSAIRLSNEFGADTKCLQIEKAASLLNTASHYFDCIQYEYYKTYLPVPRSLQSLICSVEKDSSFLPDSLESSLKTADELSLLMEESNTLIKCVTFTDYKNALDILKKRQNAHFFNKHWKDLPNGHSLLAEADEEFNAICASLKIGRRTRSIINQKNNINYGK